MARDELARFLRERRQNLRPDDAALPATTRRRTPGLRREEVADLAHMSVDYYARLEQARGPRPSPSVLDALATTLRLGTAERSHLFRLAGTSPTPPPAPARRVRPHVADLLARMPETAAIVTDATYDVVAWNPLARALLGGHSTAKPNLARRRFLDPGPFRERSSSAEFAHIVVARLRRSADRYPHDEALAGLLAELRASSEEFADVWDTNPVYSPGHRTKTVEHPEAGRLRLNCDVLTVPEDDQQVVFITADAGSTSARALRRLAPSG